jgi:hypothetical protein
MFRLKVGDGGENRPEVTERCSTRSKKTAGPPIPESTYGSAFAWLMFYGLMSVLSVGN